MAYTESDVNPQIVVHFSCADGLTLTGPSTITCVNNRRWVPDPTDVKCIDTDGTHVAFIKSVFLVSNYCSIVVESQTSSLSVIIKQKFLPTVQGFYYPLFLFSSTLITTVYLSLVTPTS